MFWPIDKFGRRTFGGFVSDTNDEGTISACWRLLRALTTELVTDSGMTPPCEAKYCNTTRQVAHSNLLIVQSSVTH